MTRDEATPLPFPPSRTDIPLFALSPRTGYMAEVAGLRTVFDQLKIGVVLLRRDGTIIEANRHFANMVGTTRRNLLGANIDQPYLVMAPNGETLGQKLDRVLAGEHVGAEGQLHPSDEDMESVPVRISMVRLDLESARLAMLTFEDVRVQREAAEVLRRAEERLEREVRRLRLLREFSAHMAAVRDIKSFFEAFHELMDNYRTVLSADAVHIFLYIKEAHALVREENVNPENMQQIRTTTLERIGGNLSGTVVTQGAAVLVNDTREPDAIPVEPPNGEQIKAALGVPLKVRDEILGVVRIINTTMYNAFSQEEVEFFTMLGEQLGIVLQNARLFSETQRTAAALRRSEEGARRAFAAKQQQMDEIAKVQAEFLPHHFEPCGGLEFAANCRPCADVGGDFYAVIPLSDERVAIAIGDVSGHGAKATITTATSRALLVAALRTIGPDQGPAQALLKMNQWFQGQLGYEHFVTMWLAIWDPAREVLTYAAQAHPYAVLSAFGQPPRYLPHAPAFPLGIALVDPELVEENEVSLQIGDRVIAYTDGWTESPSTEGRMLDGDDFLDFISESEGMPVGQLPLVLFMNFERHAANTRIKDDITMIAFGRVS